MARTHDLHQLDVAAFARDGASLRGTLPLARLLRLRGAMADAPGGVVTWSATGVLRRGNIDQTDEIWLHLVASAPIALICQRCLHPLTELVEVHRRFRFVAGEDEAARLDEDSDDDVLALQPRIDLAELIEDELILALPLVPRHERCPEPLPRPAGSEAEAAAENPFAILAALRRTPPGG